MTCNRCQHSLDVFRDDRIALIHKRQAFAAVNSAKPALGDNPQ